MQDTNKVEQKRIEEEETMKHEQRVEEIAKSEEKNRKEESLKVGKRRIEEATKAEQTRIDEETTKQEQRARDAEKTIKQQQQRETVAEEAEKQQQRDKDAEEANKKEQREKEEEAIKHEQQKTHVDETAKARQHETDEEGNVKKKRRERDEENVKKQQLENYERLHGHDGDALARDVTRVETEDDAEATRKRANNRNKKTKKTSRPQAERQDDNSREKHTTEAPRHPQGETTDEAPGETVDADAPVQAGHDLDDTASAGSYTRWKAINPKGATSYRDRPEMKAKSYGIPKIQTGIIFNATRRGDWLLCENGKWLPIKKKGRALVEEVATSDRTEPTAQQQREGAEGSAQPASGAASDDAAAGGATAGGIVQLIVAGRRREKTSSKPEGPAAYPHRSLPPRIAVPPVTIPNSPASPKTALREEHLARVRDATDRLLAETARPSQLSEEAQKQEELRTEIRSGDDMVRELQIAAHSQRSIAEPSDARHLIEQLLQDSELKRRISSISETDVLPDTPTNTPSSHPIYTPPNTPASPEAARPLGLPVALAHQDSILVAKRRLAEKPPRFAEQPPTPGGSDTQAQNEPHMPLTGRDSSASTQISSESVYGIQTPLRPCTSNQRSGKRPHKEVHWNKNVIVHTVPAYDPSRKRLRPPPNSVTTGDNWLVLILLALFIIFAIYYNYLPF